MTRSTAHRRAVRGLAAAATVADAGRTLSVVDTATRAVTATVQVRNGPAAVAVSPDGTRVYTADSNPTARSVSVVDAAAGTVVGTVRLSPRIPSAVVVAPDGGHVYVATDGPAVLVVDAATDTVTATVPLSSSITGLAVTPDGGRLWVVGQSGNSSTGARVLDAATGASLGSVPVTFPAGLAIGPAPSA